MGKVLEAASLIGIVVALIGLVVSASHEYSPILGVSVIVAFISGFVTGNWFRPRAQW